MKIAIVMSVFLVMSFSVVAESIDEAEQREQNKEDQAVRNISKDINRKEAREQKKENRVVEEQPNDIDRVEKKENEKIIEDTPADERDPGEEVGADSTEPDDFIPDEMEEDVEKELKDKKIENKQE